MTDADPARAEAMLNRFRRLMQELERGIIARNTFEKWEIDILLDVLAWEVRGRKRWAFLVHYERAVERQMESGDPGPPMTLSEYLRRREQK